MHLWCYYMLAGALGSLFLGAFLCIHIIVAPSSLVQINLLHLSSYCQYFIQNVNKSLNVAQN